MDQLSKEQIAQIMKSRGQMHGIQGTVPVKGVGRSRLGDTILELIHAHITSDMSNDFAKVGAINKEASVGLLSALGAGARWAAKWGGRGLRGWSAYDVVTHDLPGVYSGVKEKDPKKAAAGLWGATTGSLFALGGGRKRIAPTGDIKNIGRFRKTMNRFNNMPTRYRLAMEVPTNLLAMRWNPYKDENTVPDASKVFPDLSKLSPDAQQKFIQNYLNRFKDTETTAVLPSAGARSGSTPLSRFLSGLFGPGEPTDEDNYTVG